MLIPSSSVRFRENFSDLIRYFTKNKKISQTWYVNLRLFFSWPTGSWKTNKSFRHKKGLCRDGNEHNNFSLSRRPRRKKRFLGTTKGFGRAGNEHYILFLFRLSSALFGLLLVCAMFRKNSCYEFRFIWPSLETFSFIWACFQTFCFIWLGLTRFRKSRKLTYQARIVNLSS